MIIKSNALQPTFKNVGFIPFHLRKKLDFNLETFKKNIFN